MENNFYDKFNEKQYEAVTSNDDSILVVAGAGSGKTSVLTYRVVYLVTELGYHPSKILGFTFTNKAANEMKTRISNLISDINFPYIGTFHGICLRILREDINKLNLENINSNFNIIDAEDQLSLIKDFYSKYKFDKNHLSHKNCLNYISQLKSVDVEVLDLDIELDELIQNDFNNYKKIIVSKLYKEYLNFLELNNILDFDDIIKYCLKLLNLNSEVRNKWMNRFDYILVDEFQDTNSQQFEIIKLLSKNRNNVFAVGDPDQMIYSWRGAYDDIFKEYVETFENVKTIILERNYRSTKKILNTANKLIKYNSNRIEKNLFTDSNLSSEVIYYNAPNQDMESKYISNTIKKLIERGYEYKDIAILYRNNYCSRNIEQQLTYSSIPYHIYGGFKFYQRKEIKDLLAYLKVISNNDEISLSRIYNIPKRGISENTFLKIRNYAIDSKISTLEAFDKVEELDITNKSKQACKEFFDMIQNFKNKKYQTILNLLEDIIEKTKYNEMIMHDEEEYRLDNINELKSAIYQFENQRPNSTLSEYLQEIALLTSIDDESSKNKNFVSLMTVHIAKGLEFKNVFIIEFNEGIFPSQKSIDSGYVDEERRIAYVAITRAKENLYILSSDGTAFFESKKSEKYPSRFIQELKNEDITFIEQNYKPINKNIEKFNTFFSSSNEIEKIDYSKHCHDHDVKFEIGDWVVHNIFGEGVILDVENNLVKIAFKNKIYGVKTIMKNHKSLVRKMN